MKFSKEELKQAEWDWNIKKNKCLHHIEKFINKNIQKGKIQTTYKTPHKFATSWAEKFFEELGYRVISRNNKKLVVMLSKN